MLGQAKYVIETEGWGGAQTPHLISPSGVASVCSLGFPRRSYFKKAIYYHKNSGAVDIETHGGDVYGECLQTVSVLL